MARTHGPQNKESYTLTTRPSRQLREGARNAHYKSLNTRVLEKWLLKFLRFPFVVCVPHTVNEIVTDIILNITSQGDLMLTLLRIGLKLFELFSKEVRVKKQPGRPLKLTCHHINRRHFCFNIKSISVHPLLWMNVMLDFICMVFAGMWTTFR